MLLPRSSLRASRAHSCSSTEVPNVSRQFWGSDPRRNRIDVQVFLREHQKVLDLVSIVLYIPRRCARRKKTSQLRGSGDVKQISVAVKGGFSQGETPDVAGARCGALPGNGTRRF